MSPRGSPWESAEDRVLGEGRLGVGALVGKCALGPRLRQRKEVLGRVSGSLQRGRGAEAAGRRFRSPGSELAPGCSWLLAGAINLAAAGDLDAWHSRAAGLFRSRPVPLRSPPICA